MIKKMMLLATAIAALAAFVMPAAANAQQLYEGSTPGTPLEEEAEFEAVSSNTKTTTALGTLSCENVTIHFVVLANSSTTSRATNNGITTSGCKLNNIVPVDIEAVTADVHLNAATTGTAAFTFLSKITNGTTNPSCDFVTAGGSPGHISWVTDSDVISVTGTLGSACGPGELKGDFTLKTSNGTPINIS